MLPLIQADSVFNFDNDPIQTYSTIGFVNVNNGIAAAFYPNSNGFGVGPVARGYIGVEYYYPLLTLSGNALGTGNSPLNNLELGLTAPPPPSFSIAFSSELTSIQFNFAENIMPPAFLNLAVVQAYNNGVLVGSETAYAYEPAQYSGAPDPRAYVDAEGIGGFIGGPFNQVVITDTSGFFEYNGFAVDNIDVSAAPEPTALSTIGLALLVAGVAYRRRRR
jgi:hypothetical protein